MLALIDADLDGRDGDGQGGDGPLLVVLGDMIDRGLESAGVLAHLRDLESGLPGNVACLMGNHERMMLDFLDDPERGARWLRAGGRATLGSFGLDPAAPADTPAARAGLARGLRAALPAGTEAWLRGLALARQVGGVLCVHAAALPDRAPGDQPERVLLWGDPSATRRPRRDGLQVVHGHTIVARPERVGDRIAIDTGCWRTGRLSAAAIAPDGALRFLSTPGWGAG